MTKQELHDLASRWSKLGKRGFTGVESGELEDLAAAYLRQEAALQGFVKEYGDWADDDSLGYDTLIAIAGGLFDALAQESEP
jgi:hypothetical protein